jgi:hypothetical protein
MALGASSELADYSCPRCDTILVIVPYPTITQIEQAAAAGNPEAIKELRALRTIGEEDRPSSPPSSPAVPEGSAHDAIAAPESSVPASSDEPAASSPAAVDLQDQAPPERPRRRGERATGGDEAVQGQETADDDHLERHVDDHDLLTTCALRFNG